MRSILFGIALGLTALPAFAGELRDDVLNQLSGIEDPPTAESLTAIGPGVDTELMELAQDSSIPKSKRARALHALGWFPTDDTRAFLQAALDGDDSLMRRKAVYALGNGWGDSALSDLERAAQADDVQLRIAAANALGRVGSPQAIAVLDRRLAVETTPAVKQSIQKALGK